MALVTMASYRDPIDAELAKTRLEDAGIQVVILDQNLLGINWIYSVALGGVKVQVDEADLAAARRALREDRSAELADIPESHLSSADDGCPNCGSLRVRASRVHRNFGALSAGLGIPFASPWRRWLCEACGHRWKWAAHAEVRPETLAADDQVHERRSYLSPRMALAILIVAAVLYYIHWSRA